MTFENKITLDPLLQHQLLDRALQQSVQAFDCAILHKLTGSILQSAESNVGFFIFFFFRVRSWYFSDTFHIDCTGYTSH